MAESRKSITFGLFLLIALTLWTFWNSLANPFHFDDALFLQSPQVADPGDPWYLIKPNLARQLTYLTFYWNYRLGAMSPFGYHLVNLLLHLANVIALYFFARLLIERKPETFSSWARRWLPLASAGVFALHPVQTEAVNYVYQRATLMAAFFTLLSMISFLWSSRLRSRKVWYAVSVICFGLAAASKESALVLPLVWVALAWTEAADFAAFRRVLLRSRWIAAVLATAAMGAAWILYNLRSRGERDAGLSLLDSSLRYFWSQFQVFAAYLRTLIIPTGLSIDHDFHPAPATSLYAWLCILLLAGIVALAVFLRRRNPSFSFLVLAYLIFLGPTSSIVPSKDLLFEHRLYIPMIAASILAAWAIFAGIHPIFKSARQKVIASWVCVCLLLAFYSAISRSRTTIWGHNVRLWEDAVAKAPDKARAHYNLGIAYLDSDKEKARREFLRTVDLDARYAAALYNLGWLAQVEGSFDTARKYYALAVQADPKTWQAHHNLGNLNMLQGSPQEAAQEFEETIRLRPDYWPAFLNLATLQLQSGDTRSALQTLQSLKQVRWDLLEARYLSADALIREGRFDEAEGELRFLTERDSGGAYGDRIAALRGRFPVRPKSSR